MSYLEEERDPTDGMTLQDMVAAGMFNHAVIKYRELCNAAGVPVSRQAARKHIREMEKEANNMRPFRKN